MPSAWDSSAALFAISESLIDAVTRRLESEGARRIREMEGLR
jgi:DNA-binding MurR/RpiR family transcriptional regulator